MAVRNGFPDEVLGDLYPFEDRYLRLSDGRTLHYIEMGKAGLRRPTILLLHGNPTWSFLYRNFMQPLSRVARVIALDHMGFGRSDHPNEPSYYSLEQHIANLEEFVEKKGLKRVVPVMQDWGGPIGLGYATRHPDNIAGLVLMNTWAFAEEEPMKLPASFKALRARGIGGLVFGKYNLSIERFLPGAIEKELPESVMKGYRHPFTNRDSREGIVQFPRMIPDKPKNPNWATMRGIEERLGDLDVPARLLWGPDPVLGERFARAFERKLPRHPEPTFLDTPGHFLQEDRPELLIGEIEAFVRSLSARPKVAPRVKPAR
ncbi:MAG: alpha/beta fold hydrolase [Thermoplasmatota archaeon]